MKKVAKISVIILGAFLFLFQCKKEAPINPVVPPTNSNNKSNSQAEFVKNNGVASQFFTIKADQPNVITGQNGTKINIHANNFYTPNWQLATGDITIEFKEIFEKKDMILSNKPTVTKNGYLISDGEFYIRASQNGQTLFSNSIQLEIPTNLVNNDMQLFSGIDSAGIFIWEPIDSTGWLFPTPPSAYIADINFDTLGWINCDAFYNYVGNKTSLEFSFNNNPSETNTAIFLIFKDMNSCTKVNKHWQNGKYILDGGYEIPVGIEVYVLAFTFNDNKIYHHFELFTTTINQVKELNFVEITENDLIEKIKTIQ